MWVEFITWYEDKRFFFFGFLFLFLDPVFHGVRSEVPWDGFLELSGPAELWIPTLLVPESFFILFSVSCPGFGA